MKRKIWTDQEARQAKFPPNRIAFYQSESVAAMDAAIFQRYKEKRITLTVARYSIASNNFLSEVTEEQFLNEFEICGYKNTMAVITAENDIREYAKRFKS